MKKSIAAGRATATTAVAIIGSTGSVGRQTLEVIAADPRSYKVAALACHSNITLLEKQIRKFKPSLAVVFDEKAAEKLAKKMGKKTPVLSGAGGLLKLATLKSADRIIFAAGGTESLPALYAAIKARKKIALANKELLVTDGKNIMSKARKNRVTIIPVDSEHSAIFQCLQGEKSADIEKIILTCSGGPFFGRSRKELKNITPEQALTHPVWKMGKDISIDSATLMNKAFEIIEAKHLFNLKPEQIEVVIHPEGIVHSLVQFKDGSIKAQLSPPDMRYPIAYALAYPRRQPNCLPSLDLATLKNLTFIKPDYAFFKGPLLAYKALKKGKNHTTTLLAANTIARKKFLSREVAFDGIYPVIEKLIG